MEMIRNKCNACLSSDHILPIASITSQKLMSIIH